MTKYSFRKGAVSPASAGGKGKDRKNSSEKDTGQTQSLPVWSWVFVRVTGGGSEFDGGGDPKRMNVYELFHPHQFFSPFVTSSILWIQLLNIFWSRWTSSRLLCSHRFLWSPVLPWGRSPGSWVGGEFGMVKSDCPAWDVYTYTLAPELEISTLDGWWLQWKASWFFISFLSTPRSGFLCLVHPHFWEIWDWLVRWCFFTCSAKCLRFMSLLARWTA